MRDIILGGARHLLTTAGGVLATSGYLSATDAEMLAGALATIIGIVWSIWDKRSRSAPAA